MPIVDLKLEDVAFGGKGVARNAGKTVFVPFTIDGERVSARISREKKRYLVAELVALIEASPHRVDPQCPYFGQCGGCSYQHITYDHQLHLKSKQVEQTMRRIGRLALPPMRPIVPSPRPYGYRNRITVHAENNIVGFYQHNIHKLIDIECCSIAAPEVNQALAQLRGAKQVRDGHYGLRARSESRVFAQVNDAVADLMANAIAGMLPGKGKLLIDAFCGSGFFAKRVVSQFERVIGIDWDQFGIDAARKQASAVESYLVGDIVAELNQLLPGVDCSTTSMIVDPPATGLSSELRRVILKNPPRDLIYVSCNPATLARDVAELQSCFEVVSIGPFDMFPQTAEIEVVVNLRRPNV